MPEFMNDILEDEFTNGRGPVYLKNFQDIILWTIRSKNSNPNEYKELADIYGMNEGIENRLIFAAEKSGSLDRLVELIRSRRYPESVVKRLLIRTVLGITNEDVHRAEKICEVPSFIKILDFSDAGKKLLSRVKKNTDICVIVKASEIKKSSDANVIRISEINSLASDLYTLGYVGETYRSGGSEYITNNYKNK
jgi:predicted nucleotidyltransferase